jgi:hypothetical protein
MDQIFTSQFWHDQWTVITSAPWLVIPLLLVAGFVGWKWKGANDDGEIRGRAVLARNPGQINVELLRQYPSFEEFYTGEHANGEEIFFVWKKGILAIHRYSKILGEGM